MTSVPKHIIRMCIVRVIPASTGSTGDSQSFSKAALILRAASRSLDPPDPSQHISIEIRDFEIHSWGGRCVDVESRGRRDSARGCPREREKERDRQNNRSHLSPSRRLQARTGDESRQTLQQPATSFSQPSQRRGRIPAAVCPCPRVYAYLYIRAIEGQLSARLTLQNSSKSAIFFVCARTSVIAEEERQRVHFLFKGPSAVLLLAPRPVTTSDLASPTSGRTRHK